MLFTMNLKRSWPAITIKPSRMGNQSWNLDNWVPAANWLMEMLITSNSRVARSADCESFLRSPIEEKRTTPR